MKTIQARFSSVCPQCGAPLAVGQAIGCTQDRVWRCLRCTQLFDEIFRETGYVRPGQRVYFADDAAVEARDRKVREIAARHGYAFVLVSGGMTALRPTEVK